MNKNILILLTLCLFFLIIISNGFSAENAQGPADAVSPKESVTDPFDLPSELQSLVTVQEYVKSQEAKDDKPPQINLQGVVWGEKTPVAFIDSGAYKTGDIVSGAKIIKIDKSGVGFSYHDKEFWINTKK